MTNIATINRICEIVEDVGFTPVYDTLTHNLVFTEPESGIEISAVVQGEEDTFMLCNQISIGTISNETIESNPMGVLNDLTGISNGIHTSNFQTVPVDNGVATVITNYVSLQDLQEDDIADITFGLQSLFADLLESQELLQKHLS